MPPPDGLEISDADRKKLLDWIDSELQLIPCSHPHHAGSVTLRRLTRDEYANTIRDLLGVGFDPAERFRRSARPAPVPGRLGPMPPY